MVLAFRVTQSTHCLPSLTPGPLRLSRDERGAPNPSCCIWSLKRLRWTAGGTVIVSVYLEATIVRFLFVMLRESPLA